MPGKLYLCATPIGNLKDITLRVLETLKIVDLIAAEDTRRTRKLLTHYKIKQRVISFHDQNELKVLPKLLTGLHQGKIIAQVSDAGLPGIADPGHRLVKACVADNIPIEVLPGPSALLTAAVLSGLPTDDIHFLGWLPRKAGGRARLFGELKDVRSTLVFYESPRRLKRALADIGETFASRDVFIGRELTKRFEEHLRGPAKQLLEEIGEREIKGEIVIVIAGNRAKPKPLETTQIIDEISKETRAGKSKSEAIKIVAARFHLPRRQVYALAHSQNSGDSGDIPYPPY